jgi:hypothetical protein
MKISWVRGMLGAVGRKQAIFLQVDWIITDTLQGFFLAGTAAGLAGMAWSNIQTPGRNNENQPFLD